MDLTTLLSSARPWYDFNWMVRHYHNWGHANLVGAAVYEMTDHAPSDSLVLAAFWHDAVYVPGAGEDANERCSAAALMMVAADYAISKEDKETLVRAKSLILGTSIEWHLIDQRLTGDHAILLDADLSSLAQPYDKFVTTQISIIEEAGGTFGQHHAQSAAFLKQFLARPNRKFIYHTAYGREHWEVTARANIERYAAEVDNKSV